jgi:hypothetical protein
MSGVYVGYAAGIMVITESTHQYHRKEYPNTAREIMGRVNVEMKRVRVV